MKTMIDPQLISAASSALAKASAMALETLNDDAKRNLGCYVVKNGLGHEERVDFKLYKGTWAEGLGNCRLMLVDSGPCTCKVEECPAFKMDGCTRTRVLVEPVAKGMEVRLAPHYHFHGEHVHVITGRYSDGNVILGPGGTVNYPPKKLHSPVFDGLLMVCCA
jgi:hypothetical protein